MKYFLSLIFILLLVSSSYSAEIFSENYDSITDGWNCSDATPLGWSGKSTCDSETYNSIFHYSGEISSGGRSGNSLKQWRHAGTFGTNYSGYLNKVLTSTEFANNYRDLNFRTYIKIPSELDATSCSGECPKFMGRIYGGSTAGATSKEILLDLNGSTMQGSKLKVYITGASAPLNSLYSTALASTFDLFDGNWHSLELGLKISTTGSSDGEVHLYVDGVEIELEDGAGNNDSVGMTGISFNWASNEFMTTYLVPGVGNLTQEGTAVYTTTDGDWHAIEWDDYAVGTTYIGLEGAATSPTITPVNIPDQAQGTTSVTPTLTATDDVAVTACKWSTSNVVYTNMTNTMTNTTGNTWTGDSDYSGLSDGNTYTIYYGCTDAGSEYGYANDSFNIADTEGGSIILFDGFEDGTLDNWDDDFVAGDTTIETSPVYAGTYAVQQPPNYGNYVHFFADHPQGPAGDMVEDLSLEAYFYPSEGFQFPTSDMKLWLVNCFEQWGGSYGLAEGSAKPHSWAPYYISISTNGSGEPFGQLSRADGLSGGGQDGELWGNYYQNEGSGNAALVPGQWNKFKVRLKLNTLGVSDGIFQMWLDDVLIADYDNINFRGQYDTYGWNHLMMSIDPNPSHPQTQYIARDNITLLDGIATDTETIIIKTATGSFSGSIQ